MRALLFVLMVALLTASPFSTAIVMAENDIVIADFEGHGYGDWQAKGDAFGSGPVQGTLPKQQEVAGFRGRGLVNSYLKGDATTGTLTSPEFELSRRYIAFLIGGGKHPDDVGVELLIDGKRVRSATGADAESLRWHTWDVREFVGAKARIRVFDRSGESFGHINVDQFVATDDRRTGAGTQRLSQYRTSPEYLKERYRPQFHFTPEMNWMNDPNGLVYFDGEYHLFYQHNPLGNRWGHMSWGHAVSRDLVYWEHLPIAIHEEYGVMAFSGSCVVDWHNTSGFGDGETPPLIAIYTGHGHGRQVQDIAYSNDRGRSWTKYRQNPVLDIGQAEFRDPKVFWHAPDQRWVMVVSLAPQKVLQFYGSPDLKSWTHLSDFGPAGASKKPNWECPDLFPLPVEGEQGDGEPGQSKWVLEVDMGSGAVAGGSGGEYFVGDFDGTRFIPDDPQETVRWVDYGRDFYAAVSWSDIPQADGRRIWIGWMNNWQTALLPTHPWRSAMSVPRTLSLRRFDDGLRMVQTPVQELEKLRREPVELGPMDISEGAHSLDEQGIAGDRLEILAEFELGDAQQFGLAVRVGDKERTTVGYDVAAGEMFVDRTASGESDFHEQFAGRHAGPLQPIDGRVTLRLFIDASSVEVFGNAGETVITDRIFPDPASQGVSLFATGGSARLVSLRAWRLESIW